VSIEREMGTPVHVLGDEGKLSQVVLNLLINAGHATAEAGGKTITVRTDDDGIGAFIEIEDEGPGVPAELREQIFEPFFSTKDVNKGTGLGLSISREIAEQHGGRLTVSDGDKGGARFRLWVPEGKKKRARSQPPEPVLDEGVRLRILFVDDDERIRTVFQRRLSQNHDVVMAVDGVDAIEKIEKSDREFDVVVLDMQLPKMDGDAVFEWLQENRPELAERTLIASGGPTDEKAALFLSKHADRLISKPAKLDQMERAVVAMATYEYMGE
jgi:CheY-like chemotaxis protein